MSQSIVSQLTDEEIIERVLKGEVESYGLLVDRYKRYIYTVVFNILKVEEDAEEVSQDVFLKAYKNLTKFNQEAKFSTWLYRIGFNTALTAKRKQKVHIEYDNQVHAPEVFQQSQIEHEDRRKHIADAMSKLNEADCIALTLFYFEELSLEEISQITDITFSTLKVRLHRARKRLATELKLLLNEEALNL